VSGEEPDLVVRRILVALDASPHSLAALQAAAELAARFEAEVLGLFVEDVNLLRLAELPFMQEVCVCTTARRRLGIPEIERQLRAQAVRVRRSLATHARRAHVRWSFQVTRGVIPTELVAAASQADVIMLGKTGRSLAGERRLGSTARAVLADAPGLTLIIQQGGHLRLPLVVIHDGSPLAQKALAAAASLVQGWDGHIIVFILAHETEAARRVKTHASKWLQERGLVARYRVPTEPSVSRLARLVRMERGGTLILPATSSRLSPKALLELLGEVEIPVLLVR
jgi:nucleotide-binding universal stress UspA family protein